MIYENEIIMLILGSGVLIFTLFHQAQIKRIPNWRTLMAGFYILIAAWVLTVLEGFVWQSLLNYLEHLCYAVSSALVAVWCFKLVSQRPKEIQ